MAHEFRLIFIRNTVKQRRYLTHMISPDKFNMTTLRLDNHPQSFLAADQSLGSVCPGFDEPRSRSELASADQCLKFL